MLLLAIHPSFQNLLFMEFNLQRLLFLFKKDLRNLVLPTFLTTTVIFVVILGFNVFGLLDSRGPANLDIFGSFLFFFYISLAIVGSISWEEINKRNKRIDYLVLPASTLEKTASKFLSVMLVYPLLMILLYIVLAPLVNSVAGVLYDGPITFNYNADSKLILANAGLIIVSFFSYGSIKFNTGSFIKIILWGLAMLGIFALISFIIALTLYPDLRAEVFGYETDLKRSMNIDPGDHWIPQLGQKLYYIVPLIFWTMSFYTLKEKEA